MQNKKGDKLSKTDKFICKNIANSFSNIVRLSTNEPFRKECYKLANVDNSKQLEEKIFVNLKNICLGELVSKSDGKNVGQKRSLQDVTNKQVFLETPAKKAMNTNWLAMAVNQNKAITKDLQNNLNNIDEASTMALDISTSFTSSNHILIDATINKSFTDYQSSADSPSNSTYKEVGYNPRSLPVTPKVRQNWLAIASSQNKKLSNKKNISENSMEGVSAEYGCLSKTPSDNSENEFFNRLGKNQIEQVRRTLFQISNDDFNNPNSI